MEVPKRIEQTWTGLSKVKGHLHDAMLELYDGPLNTN